MRKKTHEEYVSEVANINSNIEVVGQFIGVHIPILHRCKIDGYIWLTRPKGVLNKHGCPVCSGHTIGQAPEYKNSIWASEYKEYFSQYMSEEQMKTYMPHSNQQVNITCPNCGNIKLISINKLCCRGLCCICSDKISFANKFVFNVLKQLGIKVKIEYSPKWAQCRKYDDYLPEYNLIIENHGMQHYARGFESIGGRTLQEEQLNDMTKQNLAHENNIKHYIVLDCRYSTLSWIQTSIINSDLFKILNCKETDIDWYEALKYATNSLVSYTAELFNQGMSIKDIANNIGYSTNAIRGWLCDATKLGICDYDPIRYKQQYYNSLKKSVRCVELNKIFSSLTEASKSVKQSDKSKISRCCYNSNLTSGGYHWEFVER
jgi:hypothetical protein